MELENIHNSDIIDVTIDDDYDITYDDIIEHVKAVNAGQSNKIPHLQAKVKEFIIEIEYERDKLDDIINLLWENVFRPFVEYESSLILYDDNIRTKTEFYSCLYNNTNIGKKITYIFDLLKDLLKYNLVIDKT